MRHKGAFITIMIILVIIGFEIAGLINIHRTTANCRQENIELDKQITQLKQQRANDKDTYQTEIQRALKMSQETDIIFGYVTGYLAATNRKLITDELPEFAELTVKYAKEAGVSPFDCLTICQIENGYDLYKPGKAGEQGPAQLMAATWKVYYKGFGYKPDDFYKWQANYRVAIAHFAELMRQNNYDVAAAIGEYNGGKRWARIASSRSHVGKFEVANRGILHLRKRGL